MKNSAKIKANEETSEIWSEILEEGAFLEILDEVNRDEKNTRQIVHQRRKAWKHKNTNYSSSPN